MRFLSALAFFALALPSLSQTPTNIEAVEYDPSGNRWFVSNGSSLLVTSDQGASWSFFGEAQASHGMEVMGGVLYAIGSNVIRAYDLSNAQQLGVLVIPGVGFLNGMGSDGNGLLVVSDFSSGRLYKVDAADPASMSHSILAGDFGETPNGVVVDAENNRAIVVCWGFSAPILAVDLESGEVSTVVENTGLGNLDGIDNDGQGGYYVSSWSPTRVTRFTEEFTQSETAVTGASGLSSPADISYAMELDTLGVANSGNNQVTFHGFGTTSAVESPALAWSASHSGDRLTLNTPSVGEVKIQWMDVTGRVVFERREWLSEGSFSLAWPECPNCFARIQHLGRVEVVR